MSPEQPVLAVIRVRNVGPPHFSQKLLIPDGGRHVLSCDLSLNSNEETQILENININAKTLLLILNNLKQMQVE